MRAALFGLLATLALVAAPARGQSPSAPLGEYWMRVYALPAYGGIWRLTIQVRDFKKGLEKALEILDRKGQTILPMQNMAGSEKGGFQQLSYRLPADAAPKVFAALQRLGDVEDLQKNPGVDPGLREEVHTKLLKLREERDGHKTALADAPAIRAALDEIVSHLENVEKADQEAQSSVLLNVQVSGAPAKPKAKKSGL